MRRRVSGCLAIIVMMLILTIQPITVFAEDNISDGSEVTMPRMTAGNSISEATSINIGSTYNGSITSTNTEDYYKFTISSSGRVSLTATAEMKWIYYYIYDSSGNELWDLNPSWNSTTELNNTDEVVDLTKGTYYFAVIQDNNYTGNYSMKLNFSNANESFTETGSGTNNTIGTANSINVDTLYKGQIALNDEKDFYKFTLSSSGRLTISATAEMKWIYYYIYDSSGNELWDLNPSWNSTTELNNTDEVVDLTKGTYYFAVIQDNNYTGNYSMKLNFSNANESFTETGSGNDNTISTARSIELCVKYSGQIAINDEKDFYKFTLPYTTKIKFTSTANMKWVYYYLYDSSGNQIWETNPYWNSTTQKISTSENVDLSAGTYYLAVERDNLYTGPYTFKITPDLDAPAKVTVNLCGYNDLKASWSEVDGATGYYVYYKNSAWNSYEKLGSTTKLSYSKEDLADGAKYSFRVYPYVEINGQKYRDNSYISSGYVYTLKKLNKPAVSKSSKSSVKVSWNNIPGESGYEIAKSKYSNKKFTVVKRVSYKYKSTTIKTSRNVKYYYKVRAYKTVDGKRIYGPWSSVKSYTL